MLRLPNPPFENMNIERCQSREASITDALIEMYFAGASMRRVEKITDLLWGTSDSHSPTDEKKQKLYGQIDEWRYHCLEGEYPYVFLDGMSLNRALGNGVKNVSILVAIGVAQDGFLQILGVSEGDKKENGSWSTFLNHLKDRGLRGVKLVVSGKAVELQESLGELYPDARWQRCTSDFYRNLFEVVPPHKVKIVTAMLRTILVHEDLENALTETNAVSKKLKEMNLDEASEMVRKETIETLCFFQFPEVHWRHIQSTLPLDRIMKEIRRRTRVGGSFPGGRTALMMLIAARLKQVAETKWGTQKYLNMKLLDKMTKETTVNFLRS